MRLFFTTVTAAFLLSFTLKPAAARHFPEGTRFHDGSSEIDFGRSGGEGLGGAAWLDYDRDGDLDLYLTNGFGAQNGLFRNNGDGSFTDVTAAAGVGNGLGNSGVVVGDVDNDGYPDIFLSGEGHVIGPAQSPTRLYHNQGDGTFEDIAQAAGVVGAGTALGAAMADINNDGYLDLFIASPGHIPYLTGPGTEASHENKLYLNNGDLTFRDISQSSGIDGLYPLPGTNRVISDGACVVSFTDYNQDGWMDILVGNCNGFPLEPGNSSPVRATPFNLFRNNGDLTFTDVAEEAGLNIPGFWMGLALADYNNDGRIDFFATSTGTLNNSPHVLMQNNGDGTFSNVADEVLAVSEFGWGASAADFDNDGDVDIFKAGSLPAFEAIGPGKGSPGVLYLNQRGKGFLAEPDAIPADLSNDYSSGVSQADYDGNGFPDLLVVRHPWQVGNLDNPNGQPLLLENQGNSNHWLRLRLVGTESNRMGIGARLTVFSIAGRQVQEVRAGSSFASSESPWPIFGLGRGRWAFVKVSWPSGLSEWFTFVRHGKTVELVEGTGRWQRRR